MTDQSSDTPSAQRPPRPPGAAGSAARNAMAEAADQRSAAQRVSDSYRQGGWRSAASETAKEGVVKVLLAVGVPQKVTRSLWPLVVAAASAALSLLVVMAVLASTLLATALGSEATDEQLREIVGAEAFDDFVAAGDQYDVPYTILTAIAIQATESGKFSPYDSIDRAPSRPGLKRTAGSLAVPSPKGVGLSTNGRAYVDDLKALGVENGRLPQELLVTLTDGCQMELNAAASLRQMVEAARADGVTLDLLSCYRDYALQAELYANSGGSGMVAGPGGSNHGWGRALDFGDGAGDLDRSYTSAQHTWLAANAARFNWKNPDELGPSSGIAEPWHWEWLGSPTAAPTSTTTTTGGTPDTTSASTTAAPTSTTAVPASTTSAPAVKLVGDSNVAAPGTAVDVSTFPTVKPPIGGASGQGVGPFLLTAKAAKAVADPQSLRYSGDPSASALDYVAFELAKARDKLERGGVNFDSDDRAVVAAAWSSAVRMLPLVNPNNGTCSALSFPPPVSETEASTQTAQQIQRILSCELDKADDIYLVTAFSSGQPLVETNQVEASAQLIQEALDVSYAFSRFGTVACDPAALYAGVFPLTAETFDRFASPAGRAAGRCDKIANISAASGALIERELVKPTQRAGSGGFYPMLGGWEAMPFALGDSTAAARFAAQGPLVSFVPSPACVAAVFLWLDQASTSSLVAPAGDTAAAVSAAGTALASFPPPASCGTVSLDSFHAAVREMANRAAAQLELSVGPASTTTTSRPSSTSSTLAAGSTSSTLGATRPTVGVGDDVDSVSSGRGSSITVPASRAEAEAKAAALRNVERYWLSRTTYVAGVTPAVSRLSTAGVGASAPFVPPATASGDYVSAIVDTASVIGGLYDGDPNFDEAVKLLEKLTGGRAASGVSGAGLLSGGEIPYADLFNQAATAVGMDPRLLAAVAWQESVHFDPDVISCAYDSPAGAKGIMQFMPGTAAGYGIDPCVPAQAIPASAKMYKGLYDTFGSWDLAMAGYNAGPGAVEQYGGVPPYAETRSYIAGINGKWAEYRQKYPDAKLAGGGGGVAQPISGTQTKMAKTANWGDICVAWVEPIQVWVACDVYPNLTAMIDAAGREGVVFGPAADGFRSLDDQLYMRRVNDCPDLWTSPPGDCSPPTARPGTSNHERGQAIDFRCGGGIMAGSSCFDWMSRNAATYGFYNLPSEPWHWSTTGN